MSERSAWTAVMLLHLLGLKRALGAEPAGVRCEATCWIPEMSAWL